MRSQMFKQLPAKSIIAKTGEDRSIRAAFHQLTGLVAGFAAGRCGETLPDNGFAPARQPLRGGDEVHVDAAEDNGAWWAIITH